MPGDGEPERVIARTWTARASAAGAAAYAAFFRGTLVPELDRISGHRGALVLTRPDSSGDVEISVLTFWDSMDAVRAFAGATPERAVVEPEARALLTSFDEHVRHHEVALTTLGAG